MQSVKIFPSASHSCSPANPSLLGLNVNRGAEVKIRLRPHGRDSEFFPWEHTLGTMLHELTHNEVGPHNANFYKLLDEITRECEDLMAKEISGTGQGFDAGGVRLGGVTHNPPPTNLRSVAAAAAEKRLKVTQVGRPSFFGFQKAWRVCGYPLYIYLVRE